MIFSGKQFWAALLVVGCVAVPTLGEVEVWFEPENAVIDMVGGTAEVEIWAYFTDAVVGWGLDVEISDSEIVSLDDAVIASGWDGVNSLDGDGLAGLSLPPGHSGDVLLATVTFTGLHEGVTDLMLGGDGEDEGFLMDNGYLDDEIDFGSGTITVLPEPASLLLLGMAGLFLRRR